VLVSAVIRRNGGLCCPIEVHFRCRRVGGETPHGRARPLAGGELHLSAKPVRVAVSPDNEIMDINLSDSVLPRKKDHDRLADNGYYAEDTIRHRPAIWYNDIDGAKWVTTSSAAGRGGETATASASTTAPSGQLDWFGAINGPSAPQQRDALSGYAWKAAMRPVHGADRAPASSSRAADRPSRSATAPRGTRARTTW
jgi:hypothetical protein